METVLLIAIVAAAIAWAILRANRAASTPDTTATPKSHEEGSAMPKPRQSKPPGSTPPRSKAAVPDNQPVPRTAVGVGAFEGVANWGYQLQKVSMKQVAASPFDLMVIDYSKDGSDEQAFTPGDIARMKVKPDGSRRHVLAYMSIGEAESYRYYWDPAWTTHQPAWMVGENPEWKENYTVCFWDPGWQATFCGSNAAYLDKIIAAGFDGVYLDKCDVFEDLQQNHKKIAKTRPDLEGDMVHFIQRLSHYAKTQKPTFTVVMQNAEVLLEHEGLRQAIDGVAKENLLYGLSGPEKFNPKDEITFSRRALDLARQSGRTVFAIEYLNDVAKIRAATAALDGYGYILTISPKNTDLAKLNTDPSLV